MSFYTENLCINPSFQVGTLGYSELDNAVIALDKSRKLFGSRQSLMVTAPGKSAGEGVTTADGLITTAEICSASLFIQGEGTVSVSASINPGASVAGTVPVTLINNSWQRVVIENISCTPGQTLYLTAYTTSVQQATFWIAGIQIEADATVHDYCDGDQPGCFWLSGPPGISYQPYQFSASASGKSFTSGSVPAAIIQGLPVFGSPETGVSQTSGNLVHIGVTNPVAAFDDFAIYESVDPDPAQTYVNENNVGNSGTSGNYNRIFSTFYGPLDYTMSNGNNLWNRAAYAAAGFKFSSVPSSGTQNISDVQVEILPMTATAPSSYSLPRQLKTIVIPDRLNFCNNPSIETSTANWSAIGSATLSQDNTIFSPNVTVFDDVETSNGNSLKVTLTSSGDGAQISLTQLIVGKSYTVSAYVLPDAGIANITLICGTSLGSAAAVGSSLGYGTGDYGIPPYGGVVETGTDLDTSTWYRPFFTFVASQSVQVLEILFTPGSDVSYPTHMWIDDVLVEAGDTLGTYFDGNFGPNYFWGGTANLTKSYLYDQFSVKSQAVSNVMSKHVPLGISFSAPKFHAAYTQD